MADDPLSAARGSLAHYMALVHQTDMRERWCGQAVPAAHHMEMIRALENPALGDTLIIMPRGSGKTTIVQGWLEWELGRASLAGGSWANDFRVVFLSDISPQAHRVSNAIRETIEGNPYYHLLFPKVKKHGTKWGEGEWKVRGNTIKDANFLASGVGSTVLGGRALIELFDDICTRENMQSATEKMDLLGAEDGSVSGWLDDTAKPMLVPWGRRIMTCTRWAWWDGAAWAKKQGWHVLERKALTTADSGEEESYWPERFTVPFLAAERLRAPRAFAKAYQNEVAPEEGLIFQRHWFADRFDWAPNEVIFNFDSWDTAFGQGRKRSYSAGITLAVTRDWHVYVLFMRRGQYPYSELRAAVRDAARMSGADFTLIEKKSSGHALIHDDQMAGIRMEEFQPFGQKGSPSRMEAVERISSLCAQGRVHLPSEFYCRRTTGDVQWLYDLEKELFSYPDGESDDCVDALNQGLYHVEDKRKRWMQYVPQPPVPWASSTSAHERTLIV